MEQSLARYIWNHTWRQQLWIVFIVAVSMIPYFMSFDLPKQIVNGPIQGEGFETPGATQPFLTIDIDIPFYGTVHLFDGFDFNRTQTLVGLSLVFLALVIINGLFKLYINTYKGRLGERMLRRIRFELVDRVLRFPPGHFKRVKAAEVATMVKDEVEPLGGFIGDAFVQPALLGGQALTALVFIILQSFWLGLIAAGIVAVQLVIIPQMRKRLIRLGRERQLTARALSGRVGEIVDGIGVIHINDTSNFERADIADRLGTIFKIRYDLYQWKFMVKFINNFLAQVTPFLFYLIGGWFALQGRLDIGQLVAVINAYKDLPGPLKELIDWDQNRQDVQVKYAQVVEQFTVDTILHPKLQALTVEHVGYAWRRTFVGQSVADRRQRRASCSTACQCKSIPVRRSRWLEAPAGGAEAFAEALSRLVWPESGRITAGSIDLLDLPESVTGRRMAYASSDSYLFQGTLRDNLLYGLKHAPLAKVTYDGAQALQRQWNIDEARKAGNPDYDINSDWIDYQSAGATGPDDLYHAVRPVLDAVILSQDIFDLGLRSRVDPAVHPEITGRIMEVREALRHRLDRRGLDGLVASFEPGRLQHAGDDRRKPAVRRRHRIGTDRHRNLAGNAYFRSVLTAGRPGGDAVQYGPADRRQCDRAVRGPARRPSVLPATGLHDGGRHPGVPAIAAAPARQAFANAASDEDRAKIIKLSFAYIEPRHRFGLLTPELMDKIVAARQRFYDGAAD